MKYEEQYKIILLLKSAKDAIPKSRDDAFFASTTFLPINLKFGNDLT